MARGKLGLIVNPVAGICGKAGFKGSDDPRAVEQAKKLGFAPVAPERAVRALAPLRSVDVEVCTFPREMGEDEALQAGLTPRIIGSISSGRTGAEDTIRAARIMRSENVGVILFVGGDGTARNVLDAVGTSIPALGVPSGVKTYSAVFMVNPFVAGLLAKKFLESGLPVGESEVLDIDEGAYRRGVLTVKLYGYLSCPYEPALLQSSKAIIVDDDDAENRLAVARNVVEELEGDIVYVVGPGTTTKAVFDLLGLDKTLLGVDLLLNGKVVAKDVDEPTILRWLKDRRGVILVTPIGGLGFLFGRGNQQISPEVIKRVGRENILAVATRRKMNGLDILHVDTGDDRVDSSIRGFMKIVVDYKESVLKQVI
ncbi:MAG: ATP-NAD kinase family protein [Thaumarchaeota archaeon]|nr:ATP-NAD kinase family protein [Nitrososphaerota archaeon]